jgi:hypothetical protein
MEYLGGFISIIVYIILIYIMYILFKHFNKSKYEYDYYQDDFNLFLAVLWPLTLFCYIILFPIILIEYIINFIKKRL